MKSNLRNEIKSYIVRSGYTMQEVVDRLSEDYGWSDSVSNLSNKLQRESLRYVEAVQLADALGYDLVWQKRRDKCCPPFLPAVSPVSIDKSADLEMDGRVDLQNLLCLWAAELKQSRLRKGCRSHRLLRIWVPHTSL